MRATEDPRTMNSRGGGGGSQHDGVVVEGDIIFRQPRREGGQRNGPGGGRLQELSHVLHGYKAGRRLPSMDGDERRR